MLRNGELTKQCLSFEERAATPPHMRKFRRSAYLEPGQRFQHPGIKDDLPGLHLDEKVFGIAEKASRDGAADLIHQPKMNELERMNLIKSERIYKHTIREPLGRSPDKKVSLPPRFSEGELLVSHPLPLPASADPSPPAADQPFGVKSSSSVQPAKDLIFPQSSYESADGDELYKRSHGSYAPGEQRKRGYQWKNDPTQTRFGAKGDTIALNGVSANIRDVLNDTSSMEGSSIVNLKKVEDFRNMGNLLGVTKNLGQDSGLRPRDMVYGKASGVKNVSAADVIRGKYTAADQVPDRDLGKSILPGFRNLTVQDRVYGCPSIRNDIPALPISRRSLADSQNYGDDVPAQDLVNPPAFADLSIGPMVMDEMRPKHKILELFRRIGFELDERTADHVFYKASRGGEHTTINAFRSAFNDYIIKQDLVANRK